jgi:hypothetical protein
MKCLIHICDLVLLMSGEQKVAKRERIRHLYLTMENLPFDRYLTAI